MVGRFRKFWALACLTFCISATFAIETRPYSVREFKTREIKFKSHSDNRETEAGKARASRDSRVEARGRENEKREKESLERALKEELKENERQQKELREKQEKEERQAEEQLKKLIEGMRASNEVLRAAIKAKQERIAQAKTSCRFVFDDWRQCSKCALKGKLFCAEHDLPIPTQKEDAAHPESVDATQQTQEPPPGVGEDDVGGDDRAESSASASSRAAPSSRLSRAASPQSNSSSLVQWLVVGLVIVLGLLFAAILLNLFRQIPK